MKVFLVSLFIALTSVAAVAQEIPQGDWEIYDADILGNFYLSNGAELKKLKPDGMILREYQNQLLGDIYQIDCYKGLKILVFHKTSNNIVMLDNQLAPLGNAIDLSNGGFYDVAAVCLGRDDQLWIADEQTGQLKLVDQMLNNIQTGVVYRQYTSAQNILQLAKRANLLLMVTSDNELIIFDSFGSFISKHTFNQLKYSWIGNDKLVYISDNQALGFSYRWSSIDTLSKVDKHVEGLLESKNQLYLLRDNRITKLKK